MPIKGYTVLGWVAWQIASRFAKYKMGQSKVKLGAAVTVLGVLAAGVAAARAAGSSGE